MTDKTNDNVLRCSFGHQLLAEQQDGRKVIRGYAVKWADSGDRFGDGSLIVRMKRGAFKQTLSEEGHEVAFLQQHTGPALASTQNGSLALKEDRTGLAYTAKLNMDITDAADAYHRIKDGIVTGISVGFTFLDNDFQIVHNKEADSQEMVYTRVDNLFQISLVHSPVFSDTEAVARNAARRVAEQQAREEVLGEDLAIAARAQLGLRVHRCL